MAFEIVFHYYPYSESEKEYDKSNASKYDKKIGDIFEDVSLERLASSILTQLARRDIFVFDVEIHELVKKKVSFKQTKNSISIKNKKFSLANDTIVVQEINDNLLENKTSEKEILTVPVKEKQTISVPANKVSLSSLKVLKTMIFSPSDLKYLKGKPWRFTPNKKYNIYKERIAPNGIGMILSAIDDTGRDVEVSDEFFISDTINLLNEDSETLKEDVLNWSGTKGFEMPEIRGR